MDGPIAAAPIFVFDGFDVDVHDSLETAGAVLERIDREDGVYEAFDSEGRVPSGGQP